MNKQPYQFGADLISHCISNSYSIPLLTAVSCPKLEVPMHGYLVKKDACHNVMNAACGIRCQVGFHLAGTSVRLCGENGSWTGQETHCQEKTCTSLLPPANGHIRCERENENVEVKSDGQTTQPMDTRCQFKCGDGFRIRGSKYRTCLPVSKWDGLKTTCKSIFCEPLRALLHADYHPKNCVGSRKLPYSTNCTMTCRKGYKLEGPRVRTCVGKLGTWSKRHSLNRCVDKTRPVLHCPNNITATTLPGKNYVFVNWSLPIAKDNSGAECHVWSRPHITLPWKVHIGKHTVKYIAQDLSGNKARCTFHVLVLDEEPPRIENCEDVQVFFNSSQKSGGSISWEEPTFYDNSGLSVKVNKTHHPSSKPLAVGRHFLSFKAVDRFENEANCFINLTIKDECDEVPSISNGNLQCNKTEEKNKQCSLSCHDGYILPLESSSPSQSGIQTAQISMCNSSSHLWNLVDLPDCSPLETHKFVGQETTAILRGYAVDCNSLSNLENLTRYLNGSHSFSITSFCNDGITCAIKTETKCRKHNLRPVRDIHSSTEIPLISDHIINEQDIDGDHRNQSKGVQPTPPMDQFEIKFSLLAKIITENKNDSISRGQQLKDKIQSMTKSGELNLLDERTSQEIDRLSLNLQIIFKDPLEICEEGTVLKKHGCVKCPMGTFHNMTRGRCQPCSIGEYQNEWASVSCKKCPNNYSTKKPHTKSAAECIAVCQPGHYSRRKHHPNLTLSLAPCISCEIGFYQPLYGQSQCLTCPLDTITEGRASTSASDCSPMNHSLDDSCMSSPCFNHATCTRENDGFSCDCTEHFVGSRCEIFVNPCLSSPCSSAGQCILINGSNEQPSFKCSCKPGHTGTFCETLIDECSYGPCRNGGTCSSSNDDLSCICRDGFEGDFCEVAVNHCLSSPCEMNSTCHSSNGTWSCTCLPGYLGLRCNLLPCDWLPCHPNEICLNEVRQNASKNDYRCLCDPGSTGTNCSSKIDHCENHVCQNNGVCHSHFSGYSCQCLIPFTGYRCETKLSSNYIMRFARSDVNDYAMMSGPSKNLSELTVCFWLQSVDTSNYGTVVSYATPSQDNAFTLTDYNGFILYVNGEKIVTSAQMTDGLWHFICTTWENRLGSWNFFVDGILRDNGTSLARNKEIQAGGTFVFGQEQDEVGGGFSENESFVGKLFLLDIWDEVKETHVISKLTQTCEDYHGSIVAWAQLRNLKRGNIEVRLTPVNYDNQKKFRAMMYTVGPVWS
ncbi:hypothetical protein QAD02_012455 [Eretmocerus hayati]|uniref:Uncharacterized protein n=1 Tax=Eretmocerus hayati TaxID=131215 RepID=A0ACC2P0K7_9HYME|nr:hypothetical protein QAD02_012455 [Eretmocerus hayati]